MNLKFIYYDCPKCGARCAVTPNSFEPSIAHLHCKSCGVSATINVSDE